MDGSLKVRFTGLGTPCELTVPVCDRVPTDERKEIRIRVHVFNEPFDDVGYDHDADPATPDIGAGNGVFDFNDTNGNGTHDAGEASEPYTSISPDGARNTVLGSVTVATNRVAGEIQRSNTAWAQTCVRVVQVGPVVFEDAPIDAGGMNILDDGEFSVGPGADEEVVLLAATGTAHDIAEVHFVSRFDQAIMAEGLASTPGLRGGIILPVPRQENTYLFVASPADIRRKVLAHEFGHALTNQGDAVTPVYVFFPSFDGSALDDNINRQRRTTLQTQTNARTCRSAASLSGIGNRLISGCP